MCVCVVRSTRAETGAALASTDAAVCVHLHTRFSGAPSHVPVVIDFLCSIQKNDRVEELQGWVERHKYHIKELEVSCRVVSAVCVCAVRWLMECVCVCMCVVCVCVCVYVCVVQTVMRLLDNCSLEPEKVKDIQDDLNYYIESNQVYTCTP